MAKKIKFALKLKNNVPVRDMETLKENFNVEEITAYFVNGKLLTWLEDRYYEEEAEKIRNLRKDDENLAKKLCKIFGVEYTGEEFDVDKIARQNEILVELKKLTADEEILSHYKQVAFTQEDLADLLDDEVTPIYLYGEQFSIPMSIENRKYIGILGTPKIKIAAKTAEKLTARGITFENVNLPKHLLPKPEPVQKEVKPEMKEVIQGYALIGKGNYSKKYSTAYAYEDKLFGYTEAYLVSGKITSDSRVRIFRDNKEIYDGAIFALVQEESITNCINFDDTLEMKNHFYIHFDKAHTFREGDIIEAYVQTADPSEASDIHFEKENFQGIAKFFITRGSYLIWGKITTSSKVRILRKGREVYSGPTDNQSKIVNDRLEKYSFREVYNTFKLNLNVRLINDDTILIYSA